MVQLVHVQTEDVLLVMVGVSVPVVKLLVQMVGVHHVVSAIQIHKTVAIPPVLVQLPVVSVVCVIVVVSV